MYYPPDGNTLRPLPMPEDLLTKLRSLEEALHTNEVRRSPEKLEERLHPEFEEIGRSGSKYERAKRNR